MRRGHTDGCGGGRMIGKMQVEEFVGFKVYEPGGRNTRAGKKMRLA